MRGVIVPAGNCRQKAGGGRGYGRVKNGVVREFEDVGGRDRSDEVRGSKGKDCFWFFPENESNTGTTTAIDP